MKLSDPVDSIPGVGTVTSRIFELYEIFTIKDLLEYYPRDYEAYSSKNVVEVEDYEYVILTGTLAPATNIKKNRLSLQLTKLSDSTGKIAVCWFNQPYIANKIMPGNFYSLMGRVSTFRNQLQLNNPIFVDTAESKSIINPVYPQMKSLKSRNISKKILSALSLTEINDPLPREIRDKYGLQTLSQALNNIHSPEDPIDIDSAIYRLSFDELLRLHTQLSEAKTQKSVSQRMTINDKLLESFLSSQEFDLTNSQLQSIEDISNDLSSHFNMNRLLQGDVGSGKTVVAAYSCLVAHESGLKSLVMAPTQILSLQLKESFENYLASFRVKISLATSSTKPDPNFDILIGTHSLLNLSEIEKVGLIIIDEEHRFGVAQRRRLDQLSGITNKLSMTATPIPRSLALTSFSHLDISLLEKIPERKPVKTFHVDESKRRDSYNWILKQIKTKSAKVFFVTPLIEDSDENKATNAKSATSIYNDIKKTFTGVNVGLLHGKLSEDEKSTVLNSFRSGKINVLVSTTVVEVGIDVPEATIIVIESAENFGLATLHQLRGRVGRSDREGYCLLFSQTSAEKAQKRLSYFTKTTDGEKLAKYDLKLRGPGEIQGTAQHGFLNLKLANIFDPDLVEKTKEAFTLINELAISIPQD